MQLALPTTASLVDTLVLVLVLWVAGFWLCTAVSDQQ